ncbi:MAG: RNA-binding cell elongation regulator Jag/EloR [Ruminococcus sp.]|nr:RNA-binding cell elongation regulator Jag/EloR [Ruminococcus sp.]
MKKIFTAATIEQAKQSACEEFQVEESKITFNVLEEPKKGLFGKMKGEAKIEAEYEQTKIDIAIKYIKDVLEAMGIENITYTVTDTDNGCLIDLNGDGLEEVIGKKGDMIDSLQYLSSLVSNKVDREYFRITLDSNNFRAKRKEYLEQLATKIANSVKKNGRSSALEPMNPYERRIIHATVTDIEGVTSKSTGEEPYRKVIISSTEKRRFNDVNKGNRRGSRRDRKPKEHFDITTSFEKDYKKPKPEDTLNAGLYGKIEI